MPTFAVAATAVVSAALVGTVAVYVVAAVLAPAGELSGIRGVPPTPGTHNISAVGTEDDPCFMLHKYVTAGVHAKVYEQCMNVLHTITEETDQLDVGIRQFLDRSGTVPRYRQPHWPSVNDKTTRYQLYRQYDSFFRGLRNGHLSVTWPRCMTQPFIHVRPLDIEAYGDGPEPRFRVRAMSFTQLTPSLQDWLPFDQWEVDTIDGHSDVYEALLTRLDGQYTQQEHEPAATSFNRALHFGSMVYSWVLQPDAVSHPLTVTLHKGDMTKTLTLPWLTFGARQFIDQLGGSGLLYPPVPRHADALLASCNDGDHDRYVSRVQLVARRAQRGEHGTREHVQEAQNRRAVLETLGMHTRHSVNTAMDTDGVRQTTYGHIALDRLPTLGFAVLRVGAFMPSATDPNGVLWLADAFAALIGACQPGVNTIAIDTRTGPGGLVVLLRLFGELLAVSLAPGIDVVALRTRITPDIARQWQHLATSMSSTMQAGCHSGVEPGCLTRVVRPHSTEVLDVKQRFPSYATLLDSQGGVPFVGHAKMHGSDDMLSAAWTPAAGGDDLQRKMTSYKSELAQQCKEKTFAGGRWVIGDGSSDSASSMVLSALLDATGQRWRSVFVGQPSGNKAPASLGGSGGGTVMSYDGQLQLETVLRSLGVPASYTKTKVLGYDVGVRIEMDAAHTFNTTQSMGRMHPDNTFEDRSPWCRVPNWEWVAARGSFDVGRTHDIDGGWWRSLSAIYAACSMKI